MHENAARALQYYEDLPRLSGRPDLRLIDTEPRTRRRVEADRSSEPRSSDRREDPLALTQPRSRPRERRPEAARPRERRPDVARPRPRRQPLAAPRPQPAAPRLAGRPDRVAMWAVLLGFFLTAVAAATGHG